MDQTEEIEKLKEINEKTLQRYIAKIKSAPKDSEAFLANQHLFTDSKTEYLTIGTFGLEGFHKYNAWAAFAVDHKSVGFTAQGKGFVYGVSEVPLSVGKLLVDPSTIEGECLFGIGAIDLIIGAMGLILLSERGTLYGHWSSFSRGVIVAGASGSGFINVS